jgi:hypothetical protein
MVCESVLSARLSCDSPLAWTSKVRKPRLQAPVQRANARSACAVLRLWLVLAALCLSGCSPALNWRTVSLGDTTVTLPCKPDRAQRTVQLGGQDFEMEMVGCEAEGAMFAASRLRLASAGDADRMQALWQSASLQQMKGQPSAAPQAPSARAQALRLNMVDALGQGGDARPVTARLAWTVRGADLLHLAVYAPSLTPELLEPFFDGIQSP